MANVKIIIHHGASEIGGNTVQIFHGEDSILLDYGTPLMDGKRPKYFNSKDLKNINAFLISHPHLDHTGMSKELKNIPFYMGKDTERALKIQFTHTKRGVDISKHTVINFEPYKKFFFKNFSILPIPVNHSSYGAYSFIITAGNKNIFYSGDLRAHGRSSYKWENLLSQIRKNNRVDMALLEGTNLDPGRSNAAKTETQIENLIFNRMKESKNPILIQFSPLNLDRFVSVIRACIKAKYTFIIDPYAAHFLEEIRATGEIAKEGAVKIHSWEDKIFKIYPSNAKKNIHDVELRERILRNSIHKNSSFEKCIMLVRASMMKEEIFQNLNLNGASFIYSQYSGYREMHDSQKNFENYLREKGVIFTNEDNIHTSGHIDRRSTKELIKIMNPEILIPIHTENGSSFKDIYEGRVEILENNQEFILE